MKSPNALQSSSSGRKKAGEIRRWHLEANQVDGYRPFCIVNGKSQVVRREVLMLTAYGLNYLSLKPTSMAKTKPAPDRVD